MDRKLATILEEHHALVVSDNPFQARARLLQAMWREAQQLPIGEHNGRKLGSRIAMPHAEETACNFLTEAVRELVRREVKGAGLQGKLYGQPRIFNDLLSSQPLCFNLFGELQQDLGLATRAFARLAPGRVARVTGLDFEHSPGRGDTQYLGDHSAFDVFVRYTTPTGEPGFIGIEVKYHEDLDDAPSKHHDRYDAVAERMGVFREDALKELKRKPLQQMWRDHLLAGSLLQSEAAGYRDSLSVFLYPKANARCQEAARRYRACLRAGVTSFTAWTLEDVVAAAKDAGPGSWIDAFIERYLAFERLAGLGVPPL